MFSAYTLMKRVWALRHHNLQFKCFNLKKCQIFKLSISQAPNKKGPVKHLYTHAVNHTCTVQCTFHLHYSINYIFIIVEFTPNVNSSVSQTICIYTLYFSICIIYTYNIEYLNVRIWQLNNNLLSIGIFYKLRVDEGQPGHQTQ